MKYFFLTVLLFLATPSLAESPIYSESFASRYPVRGKTFDLTNYDLEEPVVVWHGDQRRRMTVQRTRGDKYPYETQKCIITVQGFGLSESRHLSAMGFRTARAEWITEKLILIKLGLGRVAAVEEIYDVDADAWIYRGSAHYLERPAA